MNKVEGKVSDWCLKCKNCKAVTRMHGGKNASIRIIEVECEDPYDATVKTLDVDSDICCSMFEPNSPCDKISLLQHELEMEKLRTKIHQLEKEKSDHLKGIERLKKSQEKLQKSSDRWRELYNSLSETCVDYDKRSKEECEKKYRDEISKLQNTVTEKHVEIKGLKKDIIDLSYDRRTVESMSKKNSELNRTISDQEVTIKALLITIKEMCKEDETNE